MLHDEASFPLVYENNDSTSSQRSQTKQQSDDESEAPLHRSVRQGASLVSEGEDQNPPPRFVSDVEA